MRAVLFFAALFCAGAIAAALELSPAHARHARPGHHRARRIPAMPPMSGARRVHRRMRLAPAVAMPRQSGPRPLARRAPAAIAIPQESAPPQEAFASFAEQEATSPAAASDCDRALDKIAVAQPLGALVAPGECGAPDAVLLQSVTMPDRSKIAVVPAATLRCPMATALAQWVREDVAPAAAKLGSPLRALQDLGSYDCRGRDGVGGATLSEHGRANAIDLRAFKLGSGKVLVLADPKAPEDFRDALRQSACARFTTVLGPGADSAHSSHVHLDLEPRRNDYRICEWDVQKPKAVASRSEQNALAVAGTNLPSDEVPLPRPRPARRRLRAGKHRKLR